MIRDKIVELHFIDGPLAGTRKMEQEAIIKMNRTYRYLEPMPHSPQVKVPNNTDNTLVQVTCIEYHYLPFSLPTGQGRNQRYAMCLEKGLH